MTTKLDYLAIPSYSDATQLKKGTKDKGKHNNVSAVININSITDINHNTDESNNNFRLEIDTHANMPVVGKGAHIIAFTGETANVNAYNPQHGTMQIPVVDGAVQYNCPYTGKSHVLVVRNALHVPSMDNYLIRPSYNERGWDLAEIAIFKLFNGLVYGHHCVCWIK